MGSQGVPQEGGGHGGSSWRRVADLRRPEGPPRQVCVGVFGGHGFEKGRVVPGVQGNLWSAGRALILLPSPCLPPLLPSPGPLRSMVEDLQSEESDEDDSSSGEEASGKTNAGRDSRCLGPWGASREGEGARRRGRAERVPGAPHPRHP